MFLCAAASPFARTRSAPHDFFTAIHRKLMFWNELNPSRKSFIDPESLHYKASKTLIRVCSRCC